MSHPHDNNQPLGASQDPYAASGAPSYDSSASAPGAGALDVARIKRNALIACIVGFVCGGILPGILGLLGYLKGDTEPATAKKFTKWAWIVFAIIWVITIVGYGILIAIAATTNSGTGY